MPSPTPPLVVKNKVIVGVAGGEYGIRGFIAAYDVQSGKEIWKFYTVAGPGDPNVKTWDGDSWQHGGSSRPAHHGSYDPALNLVYWGTGNPGPDWNGDDREGDNLYSDSAVALDADTGKLKWHFQFTPHDEFDYDAVQIPVLVDADWNGQPRKMLMWANRNGYFYVLDRVTGKFITGSAYAKINWSTGLDEAGRPMRAPNMSPTPAGTLIYPNLFGATNWYSPAYSPRTHLFYIPSWQDSNMTMAKMPANFVLRPALYGRPAARFKRRRARTEKHACGGIRLRFGARHRSENRPEKMGIQDERRHRQRTAHHGVGFAVHGRPGGVFLRLGCPHPERNCGGLGEPRWTGGGRSDYVQRRREAICLDCSRSRAFLRLRSANRLTEAIAGLFARIHFCAFGKIELR